MLREGGRGEQRVGKEARISLGDPGGFVTPCFILLLLFSPLFLPPSGQDKIFSFMSSRYLCGVTLRPGRFR